MCILVTCKFDEYRIKSEGDSVETYMYIVFPIISQWELSVAMATSVLMMESAPNHNSSHTPILLMLHIRFDQNWPTDLGDSIIGLLKI